MTGAGMMLMSGDVPRGSVCTTDDVERGLTRTCSTRWARDPASTPTSRTVPCSNRTWLHPVAARWLAFSGAAVDAGVRAVFGFPLQVGAVRLGALNLYRDRPGALTDDQHADAGRGRGSRLRRDPPAPGERPAGKTGGGARVGRRLPLRRAPGVGHGRRAARCQRRPGPHPPQGARLRQRPGAFSAVAQDVVNRTLRFDALHGELDLSS